MSIKEEKSEYSSMLKAGNTSWFIRVGSILTYAIVIIIVFIIFSFIKIEKVKRITTIAYIVNPDKNLLVIRLDSSQLSNDIQLQRFQEVSLTLLKTGNGSTARSESYTINNISTTADEKSNKKVVLSLSSTSSTAKLHGSEFPVDIVFKGKSQSLWQKFFNK